MSDLIKLKELVFESDNKACFIERERILRRLETEMAEYKGKDKYALVLSKLLSDSSLSLKQISEIMNFNNEYYFNAFFKKYSGMPPGEYRKMLGQ
jgi:YesN/AraC family two-component response regulator